MRLPVAILLSLLPAIALATDFAPLSSNGDIIADNYIVVFKKGTTVDQISLHLDQVSASAALSVSTVQAGEVGGEGGLLPPRLMGRVDKAPPVSPHPSPTVPSASRAFGTQPSHHCGRIHASPVAIMARMSDDCLVW
jgi:hypothetical protein